MNKLYTTHSAKETQIIARDFSKTLIGGDMILLKGALGSGKTTFVQGILETLGAKKPYTSPTFIIMKTYTLSPKNQKLLTIYHIDAYRIENHDLLALGWEEILNDMHALVLLEWPERVKKILPPHAKMLQFSHKEGDIREILLP